MTTQVIDAINDFTQDEQWLNALGLKPAEISTSTKWFGEPCIMHSRFSIHREDIEGWWFLDLRLCRITADEQTIWTAKATCAATAYEVVLPAINVQNDQLYGDEMFDWIYNALDIIVNEIDAARERGEI